MSDEPNSTVREMVLSLIDEPTLQMIIQRWAPPLTLYARQWCSWPDDAVQEAFVQLISLPELPVAPVAWLFRTVRWRAQNLARSDRRREHYEQSAASERQSWFVVQASRDVGIDANQLAAALALLDTLDREIVVARIWGQLNWTQLSDLVDRPISTLHRRYMAALEQLKKHLDPIVSLGDPDERLRQTI